MKRTVGLLLALATALSTSAKADKVYIPVVDGLDAGGRATRVWITNPNAETAEAAVRFLAESAHEKTRAEAPDETLTVGPSATLQLDDAGGLARGGRIGLLEVDLAPGGFVQALRVDPATTDVLARLDGQVPVVSADEVIAGGRVAHLRGIANVAGAVGSQVGLMNLSSSASICTVQLYDAGGSTVGSATTAALEPLSLLHLTHAVDEPDLVGGLAEVSCTESFYAYASIVRADGSIERFIAPVRAADLKSGPGGQQPAPEPSAAGCPDAPAWCWSRQGTVFTSTPAAPHVLLDAVPPPHTYRRLEAHWQVEVNGFNPRNPSGAHGLLWLVRNNNRNMILSTFVKGGGKNQIVMRHGMNNRAAQKAKITLPWEPRIGATYDFDYLYDAAEKVIMFTISEAGTELFKLWDRPNAPNLRIEPGSKLRLGLSNEGNAWPEPASYGWVYKNLEIQLLP